MTIRERRPQFIRHTGIAAPLPLRDVETEFIAPVGPELHDLHHVHVDASTVSLEPHPHDGSWAGQHAFHGLRYRLDGSEDPEFVLNQDPYRRASILLAGRNFGLGSLQAFAAIRLLQCGIRVVVSSRFGPVFEDDCFDFGLLPVVLEDNVVSRLMEIVETDPTVETTVDLEAQVVRHPGAGSVRFQIDQRRRLSLLHGTSNLDERLQHSATAAAKRESDRQRRPWLYAPPADPNP